MARTQYPCPTQYPPGTQPQGTGCPQPSTPTPKGWGGWGALPGTHQQPSTRYPSDKERSNAEST